MSTFDSWILVKRHNVTWFVETFPKWRAKDVKTRLTELVRPNPVTIKQIKLFTKANATGSYTEIVDTAVLHQLGLTQGDAIYATFQVPVSEGSTEMKWEQVDVPEFAPLYTDEEETHASPPSADLAGDFKGKGRA